MRSAVSASSPEISGRRCSACRSAVRSWIWILVRTVMAWPSEDFEQTGGTLPAADTHRHHTPFRPTASPFEQEMPGHPSTRHAVGMTNRNRPAVHVQTVVRNAKLVTAIEQLGGKGLVDFPQVDVVDAQPRTV